MLYMDNNLTDSAAGKTVTNNNATFSNFAYKMGGYSGVFNRSISGNAHIDTAEGKFEGAGGVCPPLAGV